MKIAVVQMGAGRDKEQNVAKALRLTGEAVARGARLVALPEVFNYRGALKSASDRRRVAEGIPGESSAPFMRLAKKEKVCILLGSLLEAIKNSDKVFNTSVFIDTKGEISGKYRKINLFDAVMGKMSVRESDVFKAGARMAIVPAKNFRIGLTICYDLRFPLLYQQYAGKAVDIICAPSAFTEKTGRAHWETLVRARAIETLSYVLAPNQVGRDGRGILSYGNSLIVGPWGDILARGSLSKEEILFARINEKEIKRARAILPSICSKR